MSILNKIKKTIRYSKKNGVIPAIYAAAERMKQQKNLNYRYIEPSQEELSWQKKYKFKNKIKFSIIVPAYETKEVFLSKLIESLLEQTYDNFELIIADASKSTIVLHTIEKYDDKRICYYHLKENGGISQNTNEALQYATGEYCGLLDHDDVLTKDALYEMAYAIEQARMRGNELSFIYSDEDKCNFEETYYFDPHMKMDFNYDLLLSNNYICHFLVIETDRLKKIGFRKEYDGAQDFDLVLRLSNDVMNQYGNEYPKKIGHISKILYHWRCHDGSTADNPESKMYAYEAGKRALEDHYKSRNICAKVQHSMHLGYYDTVYDDTEHFFKERSEVAVLGGLLIKHNKICGGAYNKKGDILYNNLHKNFAGYMNRAHMNCNVEVLDIRCMAVAEKYKQLYEKIVGIPYCDTYGENKPSNKKFFHGFQTRQLKTALPREIKELSEEEIMLRSGLFCDAVRNDGEMLVLDTKCRRKI